MTDPKTTYPKVPINSWHFLRDRAEKSPSAKITSEIVAALFDMSSPRSARDNVVRAFEIMGIVDENGALTELGQLWRNQDTYADACKSIVDSLYPNDLAGLEDDAVIQRWFAGQGFGASNARQMSRTYTMLLNPSIPDEISPPKQSEKAPARKKATSSKSPSTTEPGAPKRESPSRDLGVATEPPDLPSLQMNLQIHLPADATAAQIDQIFESMAKHLYGR